MTSKRVGPARVHAGVAGAGARLSLGERPTGSYLLREDRVDLLSDAEPSERESIVETFTKDRHPILSFGGNAAPSG